MFLEAVASHEPGMSFTRSVTHSVTHTFQENCHNSTQPRVGLALFSYANHTTPHHKPYPTLSQLLHNQTRPNSVYNLISTKLEDSCQKN